jgi:hypothetical protein
MAEEVNAGAAAAAGADSGGGAPSTGVSGSGMSAAEIAADGGDIAFLEKGEPAGTAATEETTGKAAEESAKETPAGEVDLSALEEGQPEWLAKVTDPAVKTEVEKLLALQKAFAERFKDADDLAAFFKDLPGGREQVAALQTLSQEVAELDSALEANTPEGNAEIAERYLGMTPDGGAGLIRAAAHHMAKNSPETWNQISAELINSTLAANGIGADLNGVLGAIQEMKDAVKADDGEAFGKAAGKLLGNPKLPAKADPAAAKLAERENTLKADATKAQTESWQFRSEKSGNAIDSQLTRMTDEALAKVLPTSIPEKERATLRTEIAAEVMSQVVSDAWLASKVVQLIGVSTKGKDGTDYSKANLRASQAEWDKATEMILNYTTPRIVAKAAAKVVSKWSKDRAQANTSARNTARNSARTVDVGAAPGGKVNNGRRVLTEDMVRGPKALTDAELLNF